MAFPYLPTLRGETFVATRVEYYQEILFYKTTERWEFEDRMRALFESPEGLTCMASGGVVLWGPDFLVSPDSHESLRLLGSPGLIEAARAAGCTVRLGATLAAGQLPADRALVLGDGAGQG
jgi:hypothetical protein